jgi:galactitol-specific phosphotransferase system IIB component
VANIINKEKPELIIVLLTTHSNTKKAGSGETTFSKYVKNGIIHRLVSDYKCVFVLDEITGSPNGIFTIKDFVNITEIHPENITFFGLDASLHSFGVLKKTFEEFNTQGFIPPTFIIEKFEPNGKFNINSVECQVYSKHSYPAKEVDIIENFVEVDLQDVDNVAENLANKVSTILEKEPNKEDRKIAIYIQDRLLVEKLYEKLKPHYKVKISTSNIKSSVKNLDEADIVIATSSLSRGITLKTFKKIMVVVNHFNSSEENIVEILQFVARARGMEGEENLKKEIYMTYLLPENLIERNKEKLESKMKDWLSIYWEENFKKENNLNLLEKISEKTKETLKEVIINMEIYNFLKNTLTFADLIKRCFESYWSPKEKIVAVLPRQNKPEYYPEILSNIQRYISFLRDFETYIYSSLNEKEKQSLREFQELLLKSFIPYVRIDRNEILGKKIREIVYPYIYTIAKLKISGLLSEKEKNNLVGIFNKFRKELEEANKQIAREIEEFIKVYIIKGSYAFDIPILIYIPSLAVAYELTEEGFISIDFILNDCLTKSCIPVIGGKLGLKQRIEKNKHEIKVISFPIETPEGVYWLKAYNPKVYGDLLNYILKEILK